MRASRAPHILGQDLDLRLDRFVQAFDRPAQTPLYQKRYLSRCDAIVAEPSCGFWTGPTGLCAVCEDFRLLITVEKPDGDLWIK